MKIDSPESVGMSSERLDRIAPIMEGFVQDQQMPGILTLVQRYDKIVHVGKYGLMDIEASKPIQEDALFRIYSMTKPVVSVALMLLLEEGRISLKDPVSKYIPAFGKTKVYAGVGSLGLKLVEQDPPMTLHHLLTHTSGLSYGWFFDNPVEELYRKTVPKLFHRDQTLKESVEKLAELPLLFQPGTEWHYSLAVEVIGRVIEVVADMPLADFVEQRIFKPLGMVDTGFAVPESKRKRLAQIYTSKTLANPTPIAPNDVGMIGDVMTPTLCPCGGGGLISTAADYLAFCTCLIHQGHYEGGVLIGRKTLDWMTADHTLPSMRPLHNGTDVMDHGFGLGFRVTTALGERRTLSSVGEYGWAGAANTYFWIDPAEQLIGVMMTQYMPLQPYPVQDRFRNLTYQAIVD